MLFGSGSGLMGMFATHPPLVARIKALDSTFDETQFPRVDVQRPRMSAGDDPRRAAFAGDVTTAFASGGTRVSSESIAETVGRPQKEHVEFARELREGIPETLYDAAHSSELAYLLAVALVLDRSGRVTERQFSLVQEQLGEQRTTFVRRYYDDLQLSGAEFRLPLLEIAFPALKLRPTQQLSYLVSLTARLIEIDGEIDLYEFCFYRIMMSNLGRAIDPTGQRQATRSGRRELRAAAAELIRIVADYGNDSDAERKAAFDAGMATLGPWAAGEQYRSNRDKTVSILDRSLDVLLGLNSKGQESLLRAVSATAAHDGMLSIAEAELTRAVCATLDYPLPPILVLR